MAIDTLAKRRSALTAFQYGTVPSVEPDGSVDAADRLTAWWGYGGNALSVIAAVGADRLILGSREPAGVSPDPVLGY